MLKNPEQPSRRRAILTASSLTACATLAWAGQAVGPAPVEAPTIKLSLVIAQQVGGRVNQLTLALAGRQGERMRLDIPGDGSDAYPPLALDLTARITDDGQVMVDSVIWEGRPLAEVARPKLLIHMNQPAMVEQVDAAKNHRISLVVVASRFDAR